ncbi:MAG TPA: 5-bromo-4-chloroindolyl phosphate hydrolysis family protein [Tetragenococcus sp.]|nr:5-bromo-4-chloroindolyl phosphate hydrolysis family protein [Tetragenococcus sp.]
MKKTSWGQGIFIGLLILFFLNLIMEGHYPVSLSLFLLGFLLVVYGLKGNSTKSNDNLPKLSKKREKSYYEAGMTDAEIDLFRQTMNQAKKDIDHLQANIKKNGKLRAIDLRHDTVKTAQALFKQLVEAPKRMPETNQFLYTHLPNLVDLTDKFLEINSHEIKNRDTYDKIEESIQIIDQMAALIATDYQKFVSEDLEDLDVEISIAKQSLKQNSDYNEHQA